VTCKKSENGIGRRPESETACVPMQLNNGVYPNEYRDILDLLQPEMP
jgi:hypothetical protein